MISPEDLSLYFITDDIQKRQHVLTFYRNYHSQRFVRDDLVMRFRQPLSSDSLNCSQ